MEILGRLLLSLLAGLIGAWVFIKLKVPAAPMIGALFASALLNILTGMAGVPADLKVFTQIIAGLFIGMDIRRDDIRQLKAVLVPAVVMLVIMIFISTAMGFLMYAVSKVDLATAMLATTPGGIADMALISPDLGANGSQIVILQLVRLLTVISVFPSLIKFLVPKLEKNLEQDKRPAPIKRERVVPASKSARVWRTIFTIAAASAVGLVGNALGIPAGALTFSMLGIAAINLITGKTYAPIPIRMFAQVCAGVLIGSGITIHDVIGFRELLLPLVIIILECLLIVLIAGYVVFRISKLDVSTVVFSAVPGGLSDMALIAADLGADGPMVVLLQLVRMVGVISICPTMIKYLCTLFP